ncbi:MAG: hypothetical protein IAA81_05740 [Spirochaetes bacterium]|uniref:Uncharacterized protein n=1 Tax=Candidatus Gallitreponema excrementavium TaxID=2840840 RepID=A0A9D9N2A1_9SPIR|nr:hypothetical protein [Candidatus Gallitreponema excrementavium]
MKELNLLLQLPQDVSTRYRSVDMTVLASFATLVCQRNSVSLCKGTKAAKAAFFAMVCRFPAFAAFATLVCQKNSVFLCKGKKLKNSAKQNSWRVCRFSPWNLARCFRIQRKLDSGALA